MNLFVGHVVSRFVLSRCPALPCPVPFLLPSVFQPPSTPHLMALDPTAFRLFLIKYIDNRVALSTNEEFVGYFAELYGLDGPNKRSMLHDWLNVHNALAQAWVRDYRAIGCNVVNDAVNYVAGAIGDAAAGARAGEGMLDTRIAAEFEHVDGGMAESRVVACVAQPDARVAPGVVTRQAVRGGQGEDKVERRRLSAPVGAALGSASIQAETFRHTRAPSDGRSEREPALAVGVAVVAAAETTAGIVEGARARAGAGVQVGAEAAAAVFAAAEVVKARAAGAVAEARVVAAEENVTVAEVEVEEETEEIVVATKNEAEKEACMIRTCAFFSCAAAFSTLTATW